LKNGVKVIEKQEVIYPEIPHELTNTNISNIKKRKVEDNSLQLLYQ